MKKLVLTFAVLASLGNIAMAEDRGHLYQDYDGNMGWCINEEGVELCMADWINGA